MTTAERSDYQNDERRIFAHSLRELGKTEAQIVSRLLLRPDQRLSRHDIIGAVMSGETEPADFEQGFENVEETVGWPSDEDAEVAYDVLSPLEIREIIENQDYATKFNNWFMLFAYAPGKVPGDACPQISPDAFSQLSPAKYRLRTVCPTLVQTLESYGTSHEGMRAFYEGLLEDGAMLGLFAVTDQLLQRLVRPNDTAYKVECIDLVVDSGAASYVAPHYDSLDNVTEALKIYSARTHLTI